MFFQNSCYNGPVRYAPIPRRGAVDVLPALYSGRGMGLVWLVAVAHSIVLRNFWKEVGGIEFFGVCYGYSGLVRGNEAWGSL